jgi:hypothetical protein
MSDKPISVICVRLDNVAELDPTMPLDAARVAYHRELLQRSTSPPIHVRLHRYADGEYEIVDGWHRVAAARELGRTMILGIAVDD